MKSERLVALLTAVPTVLAWTHASENEFREAIKAGEPRLVAFINPTTAACKALEPEWTSILEPGKSTLMSIDCTSEAKLCKEFDVVSYPAIRYFDRHGNMTLYRGPKRSAPIVSFIRRAARPAVFPLDEKDLKIFSTIDDIVFIAHLGPTDDYADVLFKAAAVTYRDRASFAATETSGATSIVCYNNKDGESAILSDLTAIDAIPNFIKSCMEPLIGEFTRVTESKYLQPGKSLVYYLAETPKERDAYVESMRPLAKKYREYLNFVTVDTTEYADLALPLGLHEEAFPAVSILNPVYGQVFPYPSHADITTEAVEGFVIGISQGKVQPWNGTRPAKPDVQHDEL